MVSEKQVLDALKVIIDPDLGRDIVSLGFVKNIRIQKGAVSFTLELTTPACPIKAEFKAKAEEVVGALPGVKTVQVTMSAMKPKHAATPDQDFLARVQNLVAVSSCKGGVGKSTVAAHLARAIQREGHSVGLLDLDVYGPSFPTIFRIHQPDVRMSGNVILPVEVDGLKTMSFGYLIGDKPAVLRGPLASGYALQMLQQTEWGALDYLLIDLPPGTGDIQLSLVQQIQLDGAVIVTTPQALSLVDVARGILMFEKVNVPVLGVVENMAYFTCTECGKQHHLFGSAATTLKDRFGLDTLAQLPILPGLSVATHKTSGENVPAFAELSEHVHRALGKRRVTAEQKPVAEITPGFIVVRWPDGTQIRIANRTLRLSCPCAMCVSEYTGEALLDPQSVPEDIRAEEIEPLGNYAIAITWSDGHSSGIFSWEHLKKIS
ncbi:MAG TPA: P-loop NTPase [Candidatus Hydrogenedentes bacterium]|nr:P-loop NTPase [Candidatus Hydrogenedentota bacterium]